jgi:hypothetical protein
VEEFGCLEKVMENLSSFQGYHSSKWGPNIYRDKEKVCPRPASGCLTDGEPRLDFDGVIPQFYRFFRVRHSDDANKRYFDSVPFFETQSSLLTFSARS